MKTFFIILFGMAAITLCSCRYAKKTGDAKTLRYGKDFRMLSGNWLSVDYMKHIQQTNSPLLAYGMPMPPMAELFIDTTGLKGDTLDCGADYGLHEGGNFQLYFPENQDGTFTLANNGNNDLKSGKLKITSDEGDIKLWIYNISSKGETIGGYEYQKINSEDAAAKGFSPLQAFVYKQLIAGKYDCNGKPVAFYDDGKVDFRGIRHPYYYIMTDMCCPPEKTDVMMFTDEPMNFDKSQDFGFRIRQDSLLLYKLKTDITTDTYTGLDSLKYVLVRTEE